MTWLTTSAVVRRNPHPPRLSERSLGRAKAYEFLSPVSSSAGAFFIPSTVLLRVVLRPNYQAEALLGCEAKLPSGGGLG
jgi:hypothetical protein